MAPRASPFTLAEVEEMTDPYFGVDPFLKRYIQDGSASCSRQHLEYMLQICWPLLSSLRKVVVAQRAMTTYTAMVFFAAGDKDLDHLGAGHILFSAKPGSGKTLLGKVPAIVLGGTFGRFQGNPENMPSDFLGLRYPDIGPDGRTAFVLQRGPAFDDIHLQDEINRNNPKMLSALLQVYSEGTITVAGETFDVNPIAIFTMNPIEVGGEGTYPIPEALLDRIMFRVSGDWFSARDFADIDDRTNEFQHLRRELRPVCGLETVRNVREFFTAEIYVDPEFKEKRMGRFAEVVNDPDQFGFLKPYSNAFGRKIILSGLWGRGFTQWVGAAKVMAAFRYRNFVLPEDALKVLPYVLGHRLIFVPGALKYFQTICKRRNERGEFVVENCNHQECKHPDTEVTRDFILKELIREAW